MFMISLRRKKSAIFTVVRCQTYLIDAVDQATPLVAASEVTYEFPERQQVEIWRHLRYFMPRGPGRATQKDSDDAVVHFRRVKWTNTDYCG
jgi:hypothetical protein